MIRLVKALRQLHLSQFVYKFLAPFCHNHIDYTEESIKQSYIFLNSLSANNGSSAICHNYIEENPQYDLQIIIPAYNVEEYIEQCIDSILGQRTSFKYLICIINDGSPDNTRDIIKKYESKDNIEIIDQENRGFSGARNSGLAHIRAKYIMFVDSDDYLESKNAIQALIDCALKEDADIVEGGYRLFYKDVTLKTLVRENITGKSIPLYGFPWGKIYKAELWRNIHFPEKYWFEDSVNSFLIFPQAQKRAHIKECIYAYRKNLKGISVSSHKNLRNLDSLWITRQLLLDNKKIIIMNEEQALQCFLGQISVNQRRIETIGREDINKAVFITNKAILDEIFPSFNNIKVSSKQHQILLDFLIKKDFSAFHLAALML